nr:V protein [Metaavulavirus sp.]
MDFSNDQEIADLLELSSDVIRSIQHAESQPAKTVGKSAIRKGNTSELRTAWEAETHPQAKDSNTPTSQAQASDRIDSKGTSSTSSQLPDQPEDQSYDLPSTNTPQTPPETTIGVNGTNGLEAALRKLEKQGKSSGKTTADSSPGRDPSPSKKGREGRGGEEAKPEQSLTRTTAQQRSSTPPPKAATRSTGPTSRSKHHPPSSSAPGNRRHRREFSMSWGHGQCTLVEWCNPICAPITAEPRVFKCTCGGCPRVCINCRNDGGDIEVCGQQA